MFCIELTAEPHSGSILATASGQLDLAGYAILRDGLLKIAADSPRGLITDVNDLAIGAASPATVFPLVAARIRDWPGVPFGLVTRRPEHRQLFRRFATDRYVSVSPDADAAEEALRHPVRRQAHRTIPRTGDAEDRAREFVRRHCIDWAIPALIYDGTMIAAELVRNAIQHTASVPEVHLDLRREMLSVSVVDDDPSPATVLDRPGPRDPGLGLRIVAYAAQAWGSSRRWSGGKVVWAVLRVKPDQPD
ncbi:ATP-binding protein [Amycolatopsis solani]|uniref:ATP-binding protein n=1 Tax=Amycolatopsis solani TaxID=3028615 RepID=UPI0025AF6140|nr:ATP-binding protein [Amycolatopsis sp. MEP2-6]